jgi:hypothetical protein
MAETIKNEYFRRFRNTEISANGRQEIPIPDTDKQQFKVFNDIFITNNSGTEIEIRLDDTQDKSIPVPAKFAVALTFRDDNVKYTRAIIYEISGNVVPADSVAVIVSKKVRVNGG